jgi:hypothetical protein
MQPPAPVELTQVQEEALLTYVQTELTLALDSHRAREDKLAKLKKAYKALPDVEKKTFPWDGASNIVVPHVAIAVDAIVARLMQALLKSKDFAEVTILSAQAESQEKNIRDWITSFAKSKRVRAQLRDMFHDTAQDGDAFVEPRWVEETSTYHKYDEGSTTPSEVVEQTYKGVEWKTVPADSVIVPQGFDSWTDLPWYSTVLRHTWAELVDLQEQGVYSNIEEIKNTKKERDDKRYILTQKSQGAEGNITPTYTLFQIRGKFPITPEGGIGEHWEEVILVYSLDANKFIRKIHNPFFGHSRHIVKVPFLSQPHELFALGAAEQTEQFQVEASTIHNQIIDAGTAANAGIVVTDPESNIANDESIFPGKVVVSPNPDKIRVIHLSEPSPTLVHMETVSSQMAQRRSGVSDYNTGTESPVVGSQATATGTTALISQGNIRFQVSIDDMREAIENLLFFTIQLEQQFRPEGTPVGDGENVIQWPPGDPQLTLGLRINLTSETINRDAEIQSFQLLLSVLAEYYQRYMQTISIVMNPAFPPPLKMAAIQVIMASQDIVKRMVERFDIENIDTVVPNIVAAMQAMTGGMDALGNAPQSPAGVGPQSPGGVPQGGAQPGQEGLPGGGSREGAPPEAGGGAIPI